MNYIIILLIFNYFNKYLLYMSYNNMHLRFKLLLSIVILLDDI